MTEHNSRPPFNEMKQRQEVPDKEQQNSASINEKRNTAGSFRSQSGGSSLEAADHTVLRRNSGNQQGNAGNENVRTDNDSNEGRQEDSGYADYLNEKHRRLMNAAAQEEKSTAEESDSGRADSDAESSGDNHRSINRRRNNGGYKGL